MDCPYCKSKSRVTNSRKLKNLPAVWRRRQCNQCKAIWTTRENIDYPGVFRVSSLNKALRPFSRDEILVIVFESIKHRKNALEASKELTDTILAMGLARSSNGIIEESGLNNIIQEVLKRFDPAGETYFTAYFVNRS